MSFESPRLSCLSGASVVWSYQHGRDCFFEKKERKYDKICFKCREFPNFLAEGEAMKILTSHQMKEIDRKTIEEVGIPGPVLMENAGIQIFRILKSRFPEIEKETIVIVAGKGNNGGDGFVVARHILNNGGDPLVLLLAAKEEIRGDAGTNLRIAENIGVRIREVKSYEVWKKCRASLAKATVIMDAIFGTGLMKPAEGLFAKAIEDINSSAGFKISVDIPSGLSSDTSELIGPAVKADVTVALSAPKICHVFPPSEEWVGELIIADISIPPLLFDDANFKLEIVEQRDLSPYFQKRKRDAHKGTYGHLFIISGSVGKTGAAVMAAKAALKTGAGLVTIGTPQSCQPIVARSMMELMTEPLTETKEGTLSSEALPRAIGLLEGKDGLLLGPGLGTHESTAEFVLSLLPRVKLPVVIDADGLNILAKNPELLKALKKPAILTPHPGEFARLLKLPTKEVRRNKLVLAPAFAKKYGIYLVLKGYRTLVVTPEGKMFVNPTGNPGMATGGSGDVLSGMIASMILQEKNILGATIAAVYLHGQSGDMAARKVGERALVAGDLIRYLPPALKSLEKSGNT